MQQDFSAQTFITDNNKLNEQVLQLSQLPMLTFKTDVLLNWKTLTFQTLGFVKELHATPAVLEGSNWPACLFRR